MATLKQGFETMPLPLSMQKPLPLSLEEPPATVVKEANNLNFYGERLVYALAFVVSCTGAAVLIRYSSFVKKYLGFVQENGW